MIERFFVRRQTVQRMRSGLLGCYVDGFAQRLSEQGYKLADVSRRIRLIADFGRWLTQRRLGLSQLNELTMDTFLRQRQRILHNYYGERVALRLFLTQLREVGVIPEAVPTVDTTPCGRIVSAFTQYLAQERGLAPLTIGYYVFYVRRFLRDRFGESPIRYDALTLSDVSQHILRYGKTCGPSTSRVTATALRHFLRFLHLRGSITADLASAIPRVANWRLANLPKFLAPEEVESLLRCAKRDSTIIGQRDYTVLLLLARLGLRAHEVTVMRLEDIDWDVGELTIRGKGGQHDRLPLPVDVGEALSTYLRNGRPSCMSRHVFVRMNAPHRSFPTVCAITYLVCKALRRARLDPVYKGARILRHSLATRMLRQGASLAQVSEVLRHRYPGTTEIYAKVDLNALRKLAQPWPGGGA